jgi:polysaccharide pyruvyl transferase CsaB
LTKRVFITGYYGFGNIGDEAILAAMVVHLRELCPDLQITATSATPEATAASLGIDAILWSSTYAMLEAVRIADLVIIGGGGIFHDYWGINPASFLTDDHEAITFYAAPAAMAILFDKPVMLYAVGVGPLFSNHAQKFTKFTCDAAAAITVRDAASGRILESIGVVPDRVTITADPVFGLAVPQDIAVTSVETKRPRIAVALRQWSFGVDPSFWEQELAAGLDLFLDQHSGEVLFVPFQRLKSIPEDDTFIARRVQALMRHKDRSSVHTSDVSPQQMATILRSCDLIVGMRLHSLILGMLSNVPLLALSYDAKVEQAMESAGLQSFTLDIRALADNVLAAKIEEALAAKKVPRVEGSVDAARQNARIAIEILDRGAQAHKIDHDTIALLARGIQSQIRKNHDLRQANERFFHEFEYYHKLSSSNTAQVETLSSRIVELESERSNALLELARLEAETESEREKARLELQKSAEARNETKASEAAWNDERAALLLRADRLEAETESEREKTRLELQKSAEARTEAIAKEAAWKDERAALVSRMDQLRADTESERHRSAVARNEAIAREAAAAGERDALLLRADRLASELARSEFERGRLDQAAVQLERDHRIQISRIERERIEQHREESQRRVEESRQRSTIQAGLRAQIGALESELESQTTLRRSLEDGTEELRAAHRDASDRLQKAREVRGSVVIGLDRFQLQLASALATYRSQRAWKVMLALRKGYTRLTRGGLLSFLRWALALPFSGPGLLDEYELEFPNVWNYMPERLEAQEESPSTSTPRRTSKRTEEIPQRKYDIVIFAIFDFEFRFQRPQQFASQFARTGHRVFWISPARFLSPSAPEPYEVIPLRENIWEVRLRGASPDLYGGRLTPEDAESYAGSLEELYRDLHIQESCALLQFPYWRQAGLKLRERVGARLVYDCMDDWRNWTAEPRISDFNLAQERALAEDCDVLVVSAQPFYERYAAAGLKPLLARNGADFDFFATPRPNDLLAEVSKPVVGYYGAIADWFDLDLVTRLAESRPDYMFVLIGQVHAVDASRLEALKNVLLLGEKNYREIPLYLSHFDVCLIPFKLNDLTKAVDPVKLYEYFSQGKPVVATDMPELPRDSDLLYIGMDADDFASKVDLSLAEVGTEAGEAKRQCRIEYARSNTWAVRCRDIDHAISRSFPLVSILIVTYNCEEFIEPCLDSILRNTSWPNYEVILVDNASTDGIVDVIEEYSKGNQHIRFLRQPQNLGFAGANNLAAEHAKGEYLLFLNPDTIVPPGWLGRLVRHCEVDKSTGAVAAVTNFSGNETKVSFEYGNSSEMEQFALDLSVKKARKSTEISVAPLYCVLVPRSVWDLVGGLDSGYQIGMFEDDDFSYLIKNAGYRVIAGEDCFVHHFGNGSFAKLPPQESLGIFEKNKQYFEGKWKIPWLPHKLRPGVRPPGEEIKFTPSEFVSPASGNSNKKPEPLVLRRTHPSGTVIGQPFNLQPNGLSALVAECAHATPTTFIVMDSTILATTYGGGNLLSAMVPSDLFVKAGRRSIYLSNDFGDSNRIDFEVQPDSGI